MPKVCDRQVLINDVPDLSLTILEEEFDEGLGGCPPFDEWFEYFLVESTVEEIYEVQLALCLK
ncbi:hypothetical protein PPTG_10625 [Phytophthora nicotianae INRA-310]|uniref:Uncharacterized protein n=1 Tax=Phytophthora nicotianae (strain INRA-310) TaxID=761204 RepID=W2QBD7_PHYN3|nr:hypothetical protein PPTG_10625 [Phytophthora nicotianae INRA-310]ETN10498.1 hypothetical protein PPTG_10625 [Phytophthora nicotianae INRA-310]